MKRYFSRLLALMLVALIGLTACSASNGPLTGNYGEDTLLLVNGIRAAIEQPSDAPERLQTQTEVRELINDFAARYRRDRSVARLRSYTTVRTALNALAGHYSSYPNRPIPEKLKRRLEQELSQVELALKRGL